MSYEDICDEVVDQYHNEALAYDVLDGLDELEAGDHDCPESEGRSGR